MNQKELNQHDADKDRDGIPDRIDSSYSPPENEQRYASISPAFCDYLQKQDFSFSNGGMDGANMIVVFPKSEKLSDYGVFFEEKTGKTALRVLHY